MSDAPSSYNGLTTADDWGCIHCGRTRRAHACLGGFGRRAFKFVAMLRVKNEGRWMAEVLESLLPLCERIFVMDDHSTDDTVDVCTRYPGVMVLSSPFQGMNESRDKNWLYDRIMAFCEPEWILCVDGDEVLEKAGPDIIRENVKDEVNSYAFRIAFMWDYRDKVRIDRIYGDFWRPSMFRPFKIIPNVPDNAVLAQEFRFKATPFGRTRGDDQPNLHCSSVPQRLIHGRKIMPVRLKHYGYLHRWDRVKKLDFYTSIDWKNAAEDSYRHMCQGDTPLIDELPRAQQLVADGLMTQQDLEFLVNVKAEDWLLHAGPVQIVDFDEAKPWPISEWAKKEHAA